MTVKRLLFPNVAAGSSPFSAPIYSSNCGWKITPSGRRSSWGEIAALARLSHLYVGNDTGLTHLAAAAGARTVMILGPSDPARYAPFSPTSIALWKPTPLPSSGVSSGAPVHWNWARDGITVDEAERAMVEFLAKN